MDIIDTGGVDVHDRIFEYKVIGDIDLYKCPDIKATVQSQMRDGYRFVIFDLSDSKFIDSSAIGAFIQIVGWLRWFFFGPNKCGPMSFSFVDCYLSWYVWYSVFRC